MTSKKKRSTTVGSTLKEVLAFTAGDDRCLDQHLVEVDCLGTAAHALMLSRMPIRPPVLTGTQFKAVRKELVNLIKRARTNRFTIRLDDQDVHLAVERVLIRKLGSIGKKIHTGRSRNDQVALDLKLYAKTELLDLVDETVACAGVLLKQARKHKGVPMVGRTHMQPAMPGSVGLWLSAYVESLLEDAAFVLHAYELNDASPLGAAAGYGVPLPIDRKLVADVLGFSRPVHNVLHAINSRGKVESVILAAASQIMVTLSRMAQDFILYGMPEFGYFKWPPELGTGSSIMPQKNNPDVLEIVRARAARVHSHASCLLELLRSSPSGYNRDIQESKPLLMEGLRWTRQSVRIMKVVVEELRVDKQALIAGFTPEVFATDRVLQDVARGVSFRDAYRKVKDNIQTLEHMNPVAVIKERTHEGAPFGLNWDHYKQRLKEAGAFTREERRDFHKAISRLLDLAYPML